MPDRHLLAHVVEEAEGEAARECEGCGSREFVIKQNLACLEAHTFEPARD